jgi:predicted nuclease with TOPRIM domain
MASLQLSILSEIQVKFDSMNTKMSDTDSSIQEYEEELMNINSKILELNQRTNEINGHLDILRQKKSQFEEIHKSLIKNYEMIKQSAQSLLSIVESHESV